MKYLHVFKISFLFIWKDFYFYFVGNLDESEIKVLSIIHTYIYIGFYQDMSYFTRKKQYQLINLRELVSKKNKKIHICYKGTNSFHLA